jgi:hypothetical protein
VTSLGVRRAGRSASSPEVAKPTTGNTATTEWRTEAHRVLGVLANTRHPFTVDTLTQLAGYPPDLHQLGACLAAAKQQYLIEVAGATIAEGRLVRVWRGASA